MAKQIRARQYLIIFYRPFLSDALRNSINLFKPHRLGIEDPKMGSQVLNFVSKL